MAKDRDSAEAAAKREKKEKKKREKDAMSHTTEANGVKKSKKDKKDKKHRQQSSSAEQEDKTAAAVLDAVVSEKPKKVKVAPNGDVAVVAGATGLKREVDDESGDEEEADRMDVEVKVKKEVLPGALVPFAKPLADEKVLRKVLKGVKRSTKKRALKRGVKEVVKSLRKTGEEEKNKPEAPLPFAVIVIAGDVSPMDVISHLPVLCEDFSIPYIFVPSRAELGAASSTKRPTSVVMICRDVAAKNKKEAKDEEGEDSWEDTYKDLVKIVQKVDKDRKIY